MQLVLVALPQLPVLLHWNVADPLRQEAVSETVAAPPAAVVGTREEQLSQLTLWLGQEGGGGGSQSTVAPPQRPTHCHLSPGRLRQLPTKQPVELHSPF